MVTSLPKAKQVLLVGINDSDFSTYALQWTLDHLLAPANIPNFKLFLVYARPFVTSTVGFVGPGAAEVLPVVEADLKRTAAKFTEYSKELCKKKSKMDPNVSAQLLEYDKRFGQYGSEYTFYDYNHPEDIPSELKHS